MNYLDASIRGIHPDKYQDQKKEIPNLPVGQVPKKRKTMQASGK